MVADQDGEDNGATAGAIEVAAQRARFAQGSGFCKDMGSEWGFAEPAGEASFDTADGQRLFPERKPGLRGCVLEQACCGSGRHEIVAAQPRTVIEDKVIWLDADAVHEKASEDASALRAGSAAGPDFAQRAQHQLGVEVQGEFVRDDDVLAQRGRAMGCQDVLVRPDCRPNEISARDAVVRFLVQGQRFCRLFEEATTIGRQEVLCSGDTLDAYPTLFEQLLEGGRRELGRVLDGDLLDVRRRVDCDRAVDPQPTRSDAAFNVHGVGALWRAGRDLYVDVVVRRTDSGAEGDDGRSTDGLAWRDGQRKLVIVDGQGRNRRAVSPDGVVDRPVARVRVVGEQGVVADDVARNGGQPGGGDLVGELREGAQRISDGWRGCRRSIGEENGIYLGPFGWGVGKGSTGEIGIAASDQVEVSVERMSCGRAVGRRWRGVRRLGSFERDHARLGCLLGAQQRDRCGRCKKLGVACRLKELPGVEADDGRSIHADHGDAPVCSGD